MPTVAHTLQDETRRAWDTYAERVAGLEGTEYDRAEEEAWTVLQDTLEELQSGTTALNRPPVG
jgi:hypothetical protein